MKHFLSAIVVTVLSSTVFAFNPDCKATFTQSGGPMPKTIQLESKVEGLASASIVWLGESYEISASQTQPGAATVQIYKSTAKDMILLAPISLSDGSPLLYLKLADGKDVVVSCKAQ